MVHQRTFKRSISARANSIIDEDESSITTKKRSHVNNENPIIEQDESEMTVTNNRSSPRSKVKRDPISIPLSDQAGKLMLRADILRSRCLASNINLDKRVASDSKMDVFSSFKDFIGLPKSLVDRLQSLGIEKPTNVQTGTIPYILKGLNVIGAARTGQGKTLCFALPILANLAMDPGAFRALIITPTRELAIQIADQFQLLAEFIKIRVQTVIGGIEILEQAKELSSRPHVLIATPGRLEKLITNCSSTSHLFSFRRTKFLVMDEADRLLQVDFASSLRQILAHLPQTRQTLLFSATITDNMKNLIKVSEGQTQPYVYHEVGKVTIQDVVRSTLPGQMVSTEFEPYINEEGVQIWPLPETLTMTLVFVPQIVKECYLLSILYMYKVMKGIIIFTPSCEMCELLASTLKYTKLGLSVSRLHRHMKQSERNKALMQFKSRSTQILVATDLASRGLDIPDVQLILHMNVPNDPRDYIHRVGRTARNRGSGHSILLVDQFQVNLFLEIEKHLNKRVAEENIPEEKEILQHLNEILCAKEKAKIELEDYGFFRKLRDWKVERQAARREKKT